MELKAESYNKIKNEEHLLYLEMLFVFKLY